VCADDLSDALHRCIIRLKIKGEISRHVERVPHPEDAKDSGSIAQLYAFITSAPDGVLSYMPPRLLF